jgi:hypothetical protein
MSYTVKLSVANMWHPTGGEDITKLLRERGAGAPAEKYIDFTFPSDSVESSLFYCYGKGADSTPWKRVYADRIRLYWETDYEEPQPDAVVCGWVDSTDDSTGAKIYLKSDGWEENDWALKWLFKAENFNKNTDSWFIYDSSDTTTTDEIGFGSTQLGEVVVNVCIPFMPIFDTEALADDYLANPTDSSVYEQAINYYDPISAASCGSEKYLYKNLPGMIDDYINAGKSADAYNCKLFSDKVLEPINKLLKSYKKKNYDSRINEIKNEIADIKKELVDYKNMEIIERPTSNDNALIKFQDFGPFVPSLKYSPFDTDQLEIMLDYINTEWAEHQQVQYYGLNDSHHSFFLCVYDYGYNNDRLFYSIQLIRVNNESDGSNSNLSFGSAYNYPYADENYYYNDTCEKIFLCGVSGSNWNGCFKFYPDNNSCDNWCYTAGSSHNSFYMNKPWSVNDPEDPLNPHCHSNTIKINKINYNVPFYVSRNTYFCNGSTTDTYLFLKKDDDPDTMPTRDEDTMPRIDPAGLIYFKPIIMLFNRYETSNVNGWDGNKLKVTDGYLLAPQVGAGLKTGNNTFTGVIMGIRQIAPNKRTNQRIGLFGYHEGVQSFFLNAEDGSAIFGKAGTGQIIIDPKTDKGLLYSSNYWRDYSAKDGKPSSYSSSNLNHAGMMIDLTTPEIRFGNGNFVVDVNGHITAAGGGHLAGWKITDTTIESDINASQGKLTLDSGATCTGVDAQGNKVYSYNHGKIFSGNHNSLSSTSAGFYLSKDGLSIGNTIKITADNNGTVEIGRLTGSKKWIINGDSNNSYIGYSASAFGCTNLDSPNYTITGDTNSVYIGTDGIRLGTKFAVDNAGNMVAEHIIINSPQGWLGNWMYNDTNLYGSHLSIDGHWYDITIGSNGNLFARQYEVGYAPGDPGASSHATTLWQILPNGQTSFKNVVNLRTPSGNAYMTDADGIVADKGEIGGFTITDTNLSSANNISLNSSTGTINCNNLNSYGAITASTDLDTVNLKVNGYTYSRQSITYVSNVTFNGTDVQNTYKTVNVLASGAPY